MRFRHTEKQYLTDLDMSRCRKIIQSKQEVYMVDSRNFKKQNQKGEGLKKHKWIPLVVIIVLALSLILIQ